MDRKEYFKKYYIDNKQALLQKQKDRITRLCKAQNADIKTIKIMNALNKNNARAEQFRESLKSAV